MFAEQDQREARPQETGFGMDRPWPSLLFGVRMLLRLTTQCYPVPLEALALLDARHRASDDLFYYEEPEGLFTSYSRGEIPSAEEVIFGRRYEVTPRARLQSALWKPYDGFVFTEDWDVERMASLHIE